MLNLEELIKRYKDKIPSYSSTVTGFLMWGGRSYYTINSDEPLQINSDGRTEFITKNGLLEEYTINEGVENILYFADYEKTIEMEYKEWYNLHGANKNRYSLFTTDNPKRATFKYRYKLNEIYPHPWYPEKEIIAFKCIRIAPEWTIGEIYEVEEGWVESNYDVSHFLNFPEFFEPIYIN